MPAKWKPERVKEREHATLKKIQALAAMRPLDKAYRVWRMMNDFFELHRDLRGEPELLNGLFTAYMINETNKEGGPVRRAATVCEYTTLAQKYGMRAGNMEEAKARIDRARTLKGLQVLAQQEDRPIPTIFRILPREVPIKPIFQRMTPASKCYQAALYLILATGNRADHVAIADFIQFSPRGISVHWGKRKVRKAIKRHVFYPYALSIKPSPQIQEALLNWPEVRRPLTQSASGRYVIAQRLNDYISEAMGRKIEGFTTSYYRRRMVTILLQLVSHGKVTELEYEELLDQTMAVGRAHYQLMGNQQQLIYA